LCVRAWEPHIPAAAWSPSSPMSSSSKTLEGDLAQTLRKVNDFVDDDLLSCFLWAAGENAVAQPGWESPSVTPLKGIPLPPNMPLLPPAAGADEEDGVADFGLGAGATSGSTSMGGGLLGSPGGSGSNGCGSGRSGSEALPEPASSKAPQMDLDDDDEDLDGIKDLDDSDIEDITKMSVPLSKEQKLTQRMQRKAESARVARLRKKEYVNGLEDQIKNLTSALTAAREAAKQAGGAQQSSVPKSSAREVTISAREVTISAREGKDSSGKLEVNGTVEQFVSNKRQSQATLNEHLDCIEDILSPAAPLQVAWSKATEAKDVKEDVDADQEVKRQRRENISEKLTRELTSELSLSTQQVAALNALKTSPMKPDREVVTECIRLLGQLRTKIKEHTDASQKTTEHIRRILTAEQVPKYLEWVERHHKSMNTFNNIVA